MAQEHIDLGDVLLEWHFPEYPHYERGRWWYLWFFLIPSLLAVEAVFTRAYLFLPILALGVIILLTRLRRQPLDMHIAFHEDGVRLNHRVYRWNELENFWIIYTPPQVKKVFIDFRGPRPALDLHLEQTSPLKVREVLSEFLPEDTERRDEPFGDQLARFLRI